MLTFLICLIKDNQNNNLSNIAWNYSYAQRSLSFLLPMRIFGIVGWKTSGIKE